MKILTLELMIVEVLEIDLKIHLFFKFEIGIRIDSATAYDYFNNVDVSQCTTAVKIGNAEQYGTNAISPNYIYFSNCTFSNTNIVFELILCEYVFIDKCDIVNGIGLRISNGYTCSHINMCNNVFWETEYPIYITKRVDSFNFDETNVIRIANVKNDSTENVPHGIYITSKAHIILVCIFFAECDITTISSKCVY